MAQFPSTSAADGIWTLKKVRRAILGDNWPEAGLAYGDWSLGNATYSETIDVYSGVADGAINFSRDGTKFFLKPYSTVAQILSYDLSTAWDLNTATQSGSMTFNPPNTFAIHISLDGFHLYVAVFNSAIYQFYLSTAFDLSTSSQIRTVNNLPDNAVGGLWLSDDGVNMITVTQGADQFTSYVLTTPFDISTATSAQSQALGNSTPRGIAVHPEGRNVFIQNTGSGGNVAEGVEEWLLSTPWDASTATYVRSLDVSAQTGTGMGLDIARDGSKLFYSSYSSGPLYVYTL